MQTVYNSSFTAEIVDYKNQKIPSTKLCLSVGSVNRDSTGEQTTRKRTYLHLL